MAIFIFPYNPVVYSAEPKKDNVLEIQFKKPGNKLQTRRYENVEPRIIYQLVNSQQPLTFFTQNIKNKYNVTVKS